MPETDHPPQQADSSDEEIYLAAQASPEFVELRRRLRRFVFPMTAFFLVWYAIYVVLGAFAHDFMATSVWGNVNVGLLIGLGQFLTTFVITGIYVRFANRETRPAGHRHPGKPRGTTGGDEVNVLAAIDRPSAILLPTSASSRCSSSSPCSWSSAPAATIAPPTSSSLAGGRSPARRTASPFPATTSRRPASSVSPEPSPSTATTASSTPSASWSPGWSPCSGRRIAPQHRQIHDGRRVELPAQAAAGSHGRRHVDPDRVAVLPAGSDGGGWRARRLLLDVKSKGGQSIVIAVVGLLMIVYVLVGGMKGTTWVQIIKAVLLIAGAGLMTMHGAGQIRHELLRHPRLGPVRDLKCHNRRRRQTRRPCTRRSVRRFVDVTDQLHLAGHRIGARHGRAAARADAVLHRPDGQGGASVGGLGDRADRCVLPVHPGARLRCRRTGRPRPILKAAAAVNSAAPLLAFELGGVVLLGVISAVAFATILAVVAGLTITASASFAHDIYANVLKKAMTSARTNRSGSRESPRWCSASLPSASASWPTGRTSRSSSRWRSPLRRPRTCQPSCTRCTGRGSTPAARYGACMAA